MYYLLTELKRGHANELVMIHLQHSTSYYVPDGSTDNMVVAGSVVPLHASFIQLSERY
jgi:hypothetical protein